MALASTPVKVRNLFLSFFFLCQLTFVVAQQKNLPLNREWNLNSDSYILKNDSLAGNHSTHSQFKPLIESRSLSLENYTRSNYRECSGKTVGFYIDGPYFINKSASVSKLDSLIELRRAYKTLVGRKLFLENLLLVDDKEDDFHLTIDPLFNFELGSDLKDSLHENLYKNTRGIILRGDIGKKFSFESSFYENQATFAQYLDDFNNVYGVVPGQGRWKKFKLNGYDFAMASGYFSYSPNTHFNFQVGHGKHFVGDGYRSLLLSDNAFNYPYARITTSFGKIQYTNLYTMFMNMSDGGAITPIYTEPLLQKKAGSFQMLSWNIHKRIQLGLFQGMIWDASDSMNKQHPDFFYFNPVMGVSALKYHLGDSHNVLLGSTLRFTLSHHISMYGQYLIDDLSGGSGAPRNKQGFQIGARYFEVFGIRNLHLQLEYNQVRPFTYSHEYPAQNYTHYNQALAHPLGSNFTEIIVTLNYRAGDFFTEFKLNMAQMGKDSIGKNYGANIFSSDKTAYMGTNFLGNKQNQGIAAQLVFVDLKLGYLINPRTNMNVILGASLRTESSSGKKAETVYVYFGLRTSLSNYYYDF